MEANCRWLRITALGIYMHIKIQRYVIKKFLYHSSYGYTYVNYMPIPPSMSTYFPFFILTNNVTINIFMSALCICISVIYRTSRSVIVGLMGMCIKKVKKILPNHLLQGPLLHCHQKPRADFCPAF